MPRPVRVGAAVAGRLLYAAVVVALAATVLPTLAGYERYVIAGGSMEPAIHRGSLVFDAVVPVGELRRGDVITYVPPGAERALTHRIVGLERADGVTVVRTQGDANAAPDLVAFEPGSDRQARVAHVVPLLGWPFLALADPQLRLLLLTLPAAVLTLVMAASLWREGGRIASAR